MADFLRRLFRGSDSGSGHVAANRLTFVLVHDRSNINPALLEELKDEIIKVIQRHVEIDADGVEINLSQNGRESKLIADIPLLQGRRGKSSREAARAADKSRKD